MKILLMLMMAAAPVSAAWGPSEEGAAGKLLAARAEVVAIGGAPLLDLLAAREALSQPVELAGRKFLATVNFDENWDSWFTLKPAGGLGAGAWKESDLEAGAVYAHDGLELRLKETGGTVSIEAPGGEKAEVGVTGLFDKFYSEALKVTFGDAVTYAVFRNVEPLSEKEGTVMLRRDPGDGMYYYSVTPDAKIASEPHWLLAVNWVLYGLRIENGSLLFVSKKIEERAFPARERARAR